MSDSVNSIDNEMVLKIESCVAKRSAYIKTVQQAQAMRKMIFALVNDIEDILTCLNHQLEKMRNLREASIEIQKNMANETINIWAPIAERLGVSAIKDELEDLSLKYSNPDVYEHIKQIVALKKQDRAQYLEQAQKEIYKITAKNNMEVAVKSRAKHFWSIYQKMKKRNKGADELFDLMALRILCNTVNECYMLIGFVHTLWKPLDRRFKDYIAMPKANGYQSLHTTVLCEDIPLEIQIRTYDMHEVAEHGVASHWLYKQNNTKDFSSDDIEATNKLKDLSRLQSDNEKKVLFLMDIKKELLKNAVFVFTPQGDVIQLPEGGTAIDFAYYIHSGVGEKITGAKADGHIIPLSTALQSTQTIEILTSALAHPTFNQLQLVKTAKARSKIRQWLALHDDHSIIDDKGCEPKQSEQKPAEQKKQTAKKNESESEVFKIRIDGSTNFIITLAKCCNPSSADAITGYVSRGRGIIIHKAHCRNLSHIAEIEKRIIQVVWEKE